MYEGSQSQFLIPSQYAYDEALYAGSTRVKWIARLGNLGVIKVSHLLSKHAISASKRVKFACYDTYVGYTNNKKNNYVYLSIAY